MSKPKFRWRNLSPELTCPDDGSWMLWLGGPFWLCNHCKLHRIKVSLDFSGRLLR